MTQMKRHRQKCDVWKNRDRGGVQGARLKATLKERYGVITTQEIPEAEAKRKATLKERYGAENVFSKESTLFKKVQSSLEGKRPLLRGPDNPFSRPEVQEKIKAHNIKTYGVEHNMQDLGVRAKARATNLERFGTEESLASPVVREKIKATCEETYGGPAPACSSEIQEKTRATNQERWGVDWTCQNPEVRRKQLETMVANYGSHYWASEEGRAKTRATLVERYGVDHPAKIEGFWEKAVATFQEKYGANHPLQLVEFLEKQSQTCLETYGVESPLQSPDILARAQATFIATCQARYEVDNPMKVPRIALKALESASSSRGPNLLERRFASANPQLLYTGDGSFWRWLPKLGHHKNPDFILPGPVKSNPKKGVTKVVEVFGDYWHSKMFTGRANFDHEQELIDAFADVGISCLVVWESEFKEAPMGVAERVRQHLQS
jgi:hypothetical protein